MSTMFFFIFFFFILSPTLLVGDQNQLHLSKCDTFSRMSTREFSLVLKVSFQGCGHFTKVQQAIDASSFSSKTKTLILIDYGIYREKVKVPKEKINLVMQGMGFKTRSIEWNDIAVSNGTFESFSIAIYGENFIAHNISFKFFITSSVIDPDVANIALRRYGLDLLLYPPHDIIACRE